MDKRGQIIIISGPSGVGKTTLVNMLLKSIKNLSRCITYTTRKPRGNEKNGEDYWFVDDAAFSKLINNNKLAEWAVVNNHRYGTPKQDIERIISSGMDAMLVIDVNGAKSIKSQYPDSLSIFIEPPTMDTLKQRLEERGEQDHVTMRLDRAKMELKENPNFDFTVVNDNLDNAVDRLSKIMRLKKNGKAAK